MQAILDFLGDLAENNHKEWFDENRKRYEKSKKTFEEMVDTLIKGISTFDDTLEDLIAKKCIFRLNRDIRFSKDKTPYKTNFGASITRGGRKSKFAGYYLHIKPGGENFLAGGIYMPGSAELAAIRQEIDYNADEFRTLLKADDFIKYFGEIEGDQVKTAPKGYSKDNPNIDLLRFKSYLMHCKIKDQQVLKQDYPEYAVEVFKAMHPIIKFLNRAIED